MPLRFSSKAAASLEGNSSKIRVLGVALVTPSPLANRIAPWEFELCDEEFERRVHDSQENFKKVIKWFSVDDNGKPSEWADVNLTI